MTDAYDLITHATEEVLTEKDLRKHLDAGRTLQHYIGLEISGLIHLGTGLMCMGKVADFQRAGVKTRVFLADWHSWINGKLGGDKALIQKMARGYFEHGLKAALRCCGGDPEQTEWVLGSELYSGNDEYWETLIDVARETTLARMMRSITVLGRSEGESVDFAKLIYPAMQVADIFAMDITLAHAGMDQRKAHVVARDVAHKLQLHPLRTAEGHTIKPVAVHHPLILGLGKPPKIAADVEDRAAAIKSAKGELKMSKSKPDTAVFIHDSPDEIRRKMKRAYCLAGDNEWNPVLDWAEKLLFRREGFTLEITRPEKFGGNVSFGTYAELEAAFVAEALHPSDLKSGVSEALIDILAPAREAFEEADGARLLDEMNAVTVTR